MYTGIYLSEAPSPFTITVVQFYHHCCRGSAGIVRRVIDKNSGNQYACKFLRFNNPLLKEELQTELEVMTSLDHPNIIQVEDGYEDKKRLAIVMEMYPTIYTRYEGQFIL